MSKYKFVDDIVLAKFINYMELALFHRRLNYFRDLERIQEYETNIDEVKIYNDEKFNIQNIETDILNDKEKYLFYLLYNRGLSYEQISKITNEKVGTLKQRRMRALAKLKKELEE